MHLPYGVMVGAILGGNWLVSKVFITLSAIVFGATGLLVRPCSAVGEKTVDCTEMVQKNIMFGPAVVLFKNDAIRMNRPGKRLWFLCKAPTWELMEFNDESKTYFSVPLTKKTGDINFGVHFVAGVQVSDLALTPIPGSFMVSGVKSGKYKLQRAKPSIFMVKKSRKDYEPVREAELYVATDLHPSIEVADVLEHLYSLPPTGKLPIQLQYRDQGFTTRTFLSTASLKRVNVGPALFDPPKNYRKVGSFEELQASVNSVDLSDILQSIDRKPFK